MALFLSTYMNKIDKKGRVSVPAPFRNALSGQDFQGIVVFKSNTHQALEGFGWDYMEEMSQRLDQFDQFSNEQDDMAAMIFGQARQLPFDGDGRVVLPSDLCDFCNVKDQVAFVGMGRKFQIWTPDALDARMNAACDNVKTQGLTLPKQGER